MIDPGTATVIGAGISAAASGTSLGVGAKMNKKNRAWYERMQQKQNDFNAEQAQIAYDRQRDLLKYQNEYDSPVNQMQRYKAAGLNPALLAGNISAAGVSAPSVDSTSAASGPGLAPYENFAQGLPNGMNQISQSLMQMVALQKDTELKDSEINKNNADASKSGSDVEVNKATIEEKNANVANLAADTVVKEKTAGKIVEETKTLEYNLKHVLPADLKERFSRIQKNMSDMLNSQQLTKAQCALFRQQINGIIADVELKGAQRGYLEQQIDKYDRYMDSVIGLNKSQASLAGFKAAQQEISNKITEDLFNTVYDSWFSSSDSKFKPGTKVPSFSAFQTLLWQFQMLNALKNLGLH